MRRSEPRCGPSRLAHKALAVGVSAALVAQARGVGLPRCDGIQSTPVMEVAPPGDDGWRGYMLRSEANDCVYESMSEERIDDCMQGKWLMMVGSSNAVIQMFRMLQLFLGNEEMELYFGPEDSRTEEEWKELFYSPKNTMSVQFDFSSPEREVKCWDLEDDEPNCLAIGSNSTTTGYFSGTLQYLMPGLIDKLKAIRAVMSPDLPPPILVFSVDTWLHECVKSMTNKKHWAYWNCFEIFKEMEQVTEDAWLALNVQFYHDFLAYLRDEWPEIKEFYQEAYSYMYLVEPYFSEAVLRENGYPKVIWYRNRIDTTLVEENFIQKGHRHGPLSVAANEWLLDEVCRENREQFKEYQTPYRTYAPTCVASRKSHFAALFSCPSKASGDVKLGEILSDSSLPPLDFSVSTNAITITDARGNFEFQDLYSPFHIWVTIMSSITLLFGVIVEFAPSLFSKNLVGHLNYVRGGNPVKSSLARASSTNSPTKLSLHHSDSEGTHPSQSSYSHLFPEEPSEEDQTLLKTRVFSSRSVPLPNRDDSSSESSSHSDFELVVLEAQRSNNLGSEGRGAKSAQSEEFQDELCLKDVEAPVSERMAARDVSKEPSDAQQRESVPTKTPTRAPKLLALGMARYIASVHIVVGHMMQGFSRPGDSRAFPIGTFPTNGWGFSWVPFFMMLSGFVLTYARLFSSQPDKYMPWTTFTVQRIRGIYPLFLAGLFARAGQLAVLNETSFSLGSPFETISLLLLLQSWFPAVVVQGLQAHCWFLSCIVPYWALHQAMYRRIKEWTTRSLWAFVVGVTVVPFALLVLIPPALGVSVTWYSSWDGYTMNTNLHYAVAILKFHPVCYLHIYVFGMVAAVLVHRTDEHHRVIQWAFRQGGLIGFVALYTIFGISSYAVPPAYKLTCRLGLLAPIQGLYLIGLAKQEDALSRFFSLGVFAPLENLSFPQYIFQFIAFFGWQSWMSIGFWLWLSALSLLGYYFVQSPLRSKSKPIKVQAVGVLNIFLLAGFVTLLAFLFRYEILEQSFPKGMLPAVVEFPDGSVDTRIESSRALGLTINPSLLWLPEQDKMILAVRSHKYVRVVEGGYEDQIWYSDLYVDEVDPLTLQPLGRLENIMSSNAAWVPCPDLPYTYVPINRTYTRTRVTGPEDPRLMLSKDGKVILTANLKDPAAAADGVSAECSLNRRMIAGELDVDAMELAAPMSLMNSVESSANTEEKNWLLFEHGGALKFVQSISPFTVVRVDRPLSGETSDVNVLVESSVFHSAISDLFALGLSVHGGANPILVGGNETNLRYVTQGSESADTFLGIFHTKSVDGEYANFFFQFKFMDDTQDWRIVRVSKRIRVLESNFSVDSGVTAPMTFVSGLTANEEHVFVSYGSSNAEARVIKMSWSVLNAYFA